MGAFLARHGKQLAFIPLLLLVGVLALRLVDTVRDGSDDDARGVDETAQQSETWQDPSAGTGSDDPTTGPGTRNRQGGAAGPGDAGSSGERRSYGGGTSVGGGTTLTFTPQFPSSGGFLGGSGGSGGSSGGSSSGSSGGSSGGDTGWTGGDTGDGGTSDGTSGGSTDGATSGGDTSTSPPEPEPEPTAEPEPEPDPDYNDDGKVSLREADKYCTEEEGLALGDPGYLQCVNEAKSV